MSDEILIVDGVSKSFPAGGGWLRQRRVVQAVDNVSFSVVRGNSFGLVGESGCGKSTLARCLLRLIRPDRGRVMFEGTDIVQLGRRALRRARRRLQIVFQDPYASLSPRRTVFQTLAEPLVVHGIARGAALRPRVQAALAEVGLPAEVAERYPHEFSGGQRQRIGIARALMLEPALIVADEPVSALDVSVQAQILRLLEGLRNRRGLSFVFVSHDLAVVRHFCDQVAVMYLGRIVELGPTRKVLEQPLHPYTRMLRLASPVPDPAARFKLPRIEGEIPSALAPPSGCPFHPRCPDAMPVCAAVRPRTVEPEAGRRVECHLYG
ncbi:MAG: ABC transporter ATP-binding protein [Rhodospirillales bacterium]|nr:ABC transporter ATP-binding protein [Rhodospirillales bacterium]